MLSSRKYLAVVSLIALLVLAGCSSQQPSVSPKVKIGKPYEVNGKMYYPAYQGDYDEIGMASWYGPGFHKKQTASGEIFDQDDVTAAHRTLPMPSIVRVTNVETGQSALVRINDRGPFAHDRIIDLSRGASKKLGVWGPGTAKVRVQYLSEETASYLDEHNIKYYAEGVYSSPRPLEYEAEGGAGVVVDSAPLQLISQSDLPPPAGAAPPRPVSVADVYEMPAGQTQLQATPAMLMASAPPPEMALAGQWYVQAGSFGVQENAQRLAGKLAGFGSVDVQPIETGGRVLHRVRLGPMGDSALADDLLNKVKGMGIEDAKLVRH